MDSSGNSKGCMEQFGTFVRTHKGMIIAVEIIACVVILICYAASYSAGYVGLPICEMVWCIIIFIVFMCSFDAQLSFIHWGWTDFLRALIGALCFLITSLIVLIRHQDGAGIAGGVFGLLAGILFAYDAYTIIPRLRKPNVAAHTAPTEGI